ncbi:MAG: hypothetical protein KJ749_07495 [Planctomycetes bacterium]|nr:hypothetical protein [Planctomycetota bacterium]
MGLGLGLCHIWGSCVGAKILYGPRNGRFDWRLSPPENYTIIMLHRFSEPVRLCLAEPFPIAV